MGVLYYTLNINDILLQKEIKAAELEFTERKVLSRNIKNADSTITIDLTEVGTVKGIFVKTSLAVTLTMNSNVLIVNSVLFATLDTDITTLTLACSDVDTGADVEIIVWADAA